MANNVNEIEDYELVVQGQYLKHGAHPMWFTKPRDWVLVGQIAMLELVRLFKGLF